MVRVRKHWRRPGLLLRAHAWAPPSLGAAAPTRYLETHVWHAKRAHMEEAWGHKLAACNNALGVRALHRAMSRHCCAHDRSYMQLVEIFGSEQLIVDTLANCGADRRLILAKDARSGARRVRILLRDCGDQLITPALLLWSPSMTTRHPPMAKEPSDEEMPFTIDVQGTGPSPGSGGDVDMVEAALEATPETGWIVWLWVHPAAAQEAGLSARLCTVKYAIPRPHCFALVGFVFSCLVGWLCSLLCSAPLFAALLRSLLCSALLFSLLCSALLFSLLCSALLVALLCFALLCLSLLCLCFALLVALLCFALLCCALTLLWLAWVGCLGIVQLVSFACPCLSFALR